LISLSSGVIPESATYVLGGIIALIVIAGIILGFVTQLNSIKTKSQEIAQATTDKAVAEATKETESKLAFIQLTKSVDSMNETVTKLSRGVGDQIDTLQKEQLALCGRIGVVEASAKSAHKRLDEHRTVEHGVTNYKNGSHFVLEEALTEDRRG